jgi:hypothetical protein
MKQKSSIFIGMLAAVWLFMSCSDGTVLMRNTTGKAGETIVVIAKEYWEGKIGDTIAHYLLQPQLGLPQEEPILNVTDIPDDAFKAFETSRNIILTKISATVKEPSITVQRDVYAKYQLIISIQAPDESSFIKIFSEKSDKIIATILGTEKRRLMEMYSQKRYKNEAIFKYLKEKHNFTLNIPKDYKLVKDTSDFIWITYESPLTTQALIAYWYPYESDSTFTTKYLLHKRDSVLRLHVPGPLPGSYMTTERLVPPLVQPFTFNGNYTMEMRGLWRVQGDFMGGPFVSLTTLDASNKRVLTVEGFLYSPKYNKRDYLRQLEAIIYSLRFPDQKISDKIYQMYEIGEPLPEEADSTKNNS